MKYSTEDKSHALDSLRFLTADDVIYTIVMKVSSSGMSRRIKFFAIRDNEPVYLTWAVGVLLEAPVNDDGVLVQGCGMDMGWHSVYRLSGILCESGIIAPRPGVESGYVLDQRWL